MSPTSVAQPLGPVLSLGVDYQVLPPLALEAFAQLGVLGLPSWLAIRNLEELPGAIVMGGAGAGARLRLIDTGKGNLWASAHVGFRVLDGFQFAADLEAGYQFSVSPRWALGPFVRAELMPPPPHSKWTSTFTLTLGVSTSFELMPLTRAPVPPADDDGDGLTNEAEATLGTDPARADTDGDGLPDNLEVTTKTNPLAADTDGDGVSDGDEDRNRNGVVDEGETDPRQAPLTPAFQNVEVAPQPAPPPEPVAPPPPPDSDGDGLPDPADNCPTVAGPADNQGCPKENKQLVVITREKLEILEKVYFNTRDASVLPKSFPLLDQVAAILNSHPELKRVQIEGHTDNVGDAKKNQVLSQTRATAVAKYLSTKVDASRLEAIGYGASRPAATNDTPAGREKNRRVEFKLVGE